MRAGLCAAHRLTYSPRTTGTSAGASLPVFEAPVELGLVRAGAGDALLATVSPCSTTAAESDAAEATATVRLVSADERRSASDVEQAETANSRMSVWVARMQRSNE